MTDAVKVHHEPRMLIDGTLVEATSGRTFQNVDPTTEEVLGAVADASTEDMRRAIDAARRAFDESNWSTDRELRKRCLQQLQEALEAEQDELREELILEAGCPRLLTNGPQLDAPLADALRDPMKLIDDYAWETELADRPNMRGSPSAGGSGRSPSGWSEPSRRGTTPSRWRSTSSARLSPRGTQWC